MASVQLLLEVRHLAVGIEIRIYLSYETYCNKLSFSSSSTGCCCSLLTDGVSGSSHFTISDMSGCLICIVAVDNVTLVE